jgi:hypothetical protein
LKTLLSLIVPIGCYQVVIFSMPLTKLCSFDSPCASHALLAIQEHLACGANSPCSSHAQKLSLEANRDCSWTLRMSSPKRHLSLWRKKTDHEVGELSLDFWVYAIEDVLHGWILFKGWFSWLMSSSKLKSCLELCQFVQAFLNPGLQNRKCVPFELARVFHLWLSSEHDGILLEIHNWNKESCLWRVVATTSLDLAVIGLPRCRTFLDTSVIMFISSPFVVT